MMTDRIWVLGAPDPEMEMIERMLRGAGERVEYATVWRDGVRRRVTPAEAYAPDVEIGEGLRGLRATAYMVECAPAVLVGSSVDGIDWAGVVVTIDHHRPGDPGYGRPPAEFLSASSIGQVIRALARLGAIPSSWRRMSAGWAAPLTPQYADGAPVDYTGVPWIRVGRGGKDAWDIVLDAHTFARVPHELVLAAAADHCLAAAYRGECPGVDPDGLMRWRVETRAKHQGISTDALLYTITGARLALRDADRVDLGSGQTVADLRDREVPELPEAAVRDGVAYLATVADRDGRRKIVLGGHTSPETVKAFLDTWAPAQGLTGLYGDPARGFAGGYLPAGAAS